MARKIIIKKSLFLAVGSLERLPDFSLLHTKMKNFSMTLIPSLKKLINEYAILASLAELNLEQEEKLCEILEQASQDEIVAFWISEVDYILGKSSGLLNPEDLNYYEDQKAGIREHLWSNLKCIDIDDSQYLQTILASLAELNLEQEEKLCEILEQASQDEIVAFWISQVDYILGESLGLLKPEDLNYYEDQKAGIREHLWSNLKCIDIDDSQYLQTIKSEPE
ncbi:hypothetical protein [Okeania sp. SIO1I7]|uniref:hypothetical protein n=1 Tax=Okeania sp. SIO1I7 TaxID=2607772 RepID=UPI0013F8B88A|nr:hypothetical protein [Okeania sp. SIO1I7]NET27616.1 hypothetical protein [Okeania sp. SIO1I7]